MVISRERLAGAMTPEAYIESMRENREVFERNVAETHITDEERRFFAGLPAPLDVLVLTEDWCGDSATNLPIIVRLARETGRLTLRILRREGNEDIAGRYQLADGRNHIPTYIVLDHDLDELGHFIERPAAITDKLAAFKSSWFAQHPELDPNTPIGELAPALRESYLDSRAAARRACWDLEQREMIAAFRAIVERALVRL